MSSLGRISSLPVTKRPPRTQPNTKSTVEVHERSDRSIPSRTLFRWNAVMAVLHTCLAITTIVVGNRSLAPPLYATDVDFVENVNRTADDIRRGVPRFELVPNVVQVGSFPLTWLVFAFFACSSVGHSGNAFVWRKFYERQLAQCLAPTRYIEYALSAPIMFVLISFTAGIRLYEPLVALAVLISTTMAFGYLGDLLARPDADASAWALPFGQRMFPFAVGFLPYAGAFSVLFASFYDQSASADRAPWFVHVVIWVQFALFSTFAIVPIVQQSRAPRFYYQGEIAFQVLSLASKATLGILFLVNVLVLGSFAEAFS